MTSLNTRLLVAASLVLAAFLSVTGLVLDGAYYRSAEAALRDRLQAYAYTLIAAAAPDRAGGVRLVHPVSENRFFQPGSGLYAQIARNDRTQVWRSPSVTGVDIPFRLGLARTASGFETLSAAGLDLAIFSTGVAWQEAPARGEVYTVSVAEDLSEFEAQIAGFRRTLWGWLAIVAIALLGVQGAILRWGLAPLRRVAADLAAIEAGKKVQLEEDYPRELQGLTSNLNALVRNERERGERYRKALGDLAHSLKTPLTVLRGATEAGAGDLRETVAGQVSRMSEIVEYQLQRAATAGRSVLQAAVPVGPVAQKVTEVLRQAHADKDVAYRLNIDPGARFHGDEGDLMEILGNLIDNACKWCRHTVLIDIRAVAGASRPHPGLRIRVADDGAGLPEAVGARVFERGARVDDGQPGHGIGLAMVRDIVAVYDGEIRIGRSELGGAEIVVELR